MNKTLTVCLFSAAVSLPLVPLSASADDILARFDGGIGSQPLRAGALPNEVNANLPG
jgi:hypothetical protein